MRLAETVTVEMAVTAPKATLIVRALEQSTYNSSSNGKSERATENNSYSSVITATTRVKPTATTATAVKTTATAINKNQQRAIAATATTKKTLRECYR